MGLRDVVRKAEEQRRQFTRKGIGAAREGWESMDDVQRHIRQKMRLWPSRPATLTSDTIPSELPAEDSSEATGRDPIISVNGQDVEQPETGGGRKIA